ncbi:MAG: hypothetical protein ACI9TV_003231 [Sulfurimonas sp.]|jgi:uncharacterized protein YyaL (SSP411 family)|uniref:thioredoxin domain-containing protein n=1 Tax=Sulfurimonas sp. TaxID=2022749 RepID=UPI0039E59C5D
MENLLQYENSPYLLQHKDNPVHWFGWSDDAFIKAKQEYKPIFLSIGYSSCHWCHVMEKEVFENKDIAKYLNDNFICIKVDKEERPDIDQYYQNIHEVLTKKAGGWPTSIFLTPDNKPFYAATYIPPEPKYNIVGFMQLIQIISPAIQQKDSKLFQSVQEIQKSLDVKQKISQRTNLSTDTIDLFITQSKNNFEPTYGGFTLAPKFPQVATLKALIHSYQINKDEELASIITHTLDNMAAGGLYDLVDGGFCRYSVDSEWLTPHFEKMTYDNGLLCELYLLAFSVFDNEDYFIISKDIANFMIKFMMQENLFYSASDADTEGSEGKYFVYTRIDVLEALRESGFAELEAKKKLMRLSVSPGGNFDKKNILHFIEIQRPKWFENIRPTLQTIREHRIYPFIDKKIQTSWNAMMIRSLFKLAIYDEKYLDIAIKSIDTLLKKMLNETELMHSGVLENNPKIKAFLEDYAYLGLALISAYEVTSNVKYLNVAQDVTNRALELFYVDGLWYFSRGQFEVEAEASDSSYPSSVGAMIELLLDLGSIVNEKYREKAFTTLEVYAGEIKQAPIRYSYILNQVQRYINEDKIVKLPFQTDIKNVRKLLQYPYVSIKYTTENIFTLCDNHSCFKSSNSLEDLF